MEDLFVGKYLVKSDRYYTKDHEWVLVKEGKAWVGITDYAQKELGDIVYVDLPSVGEEFESGDTLANLESVKSVSPVYSPVSGRVVEVNDILNDEPAMINESPYEDGWIAVLEMADVSELEDLLSPKEYAEILAEVILEEKGERIALQFPEEESLTIEESLDALPEEDLRYEEREL
jgi:glycine cleavage system H protein